jgi:hypothetical protein
LTGRETRAGDLNHAVGVVEEAEGDRDEGVDAGRGNNFD